MNEAASMPGDSEAISADLLEILRCPESHETLVQHGAELWCSASKKAYPIQNGIPVLLIEESRPLTDEELSGD